MSTPLSELGENALLQRIISKLAPVPPLVIGPGDDCAVVPRDEQWDTLLKTDVVVEAVHFTRQTEPKRIGRKALARNISDIAAMGGIPEYALITLLAHESRTVEEIEGIYEGIHSIAQHFGISVVGGETASLPYDSLVLNISLVGRVEHGEAILRSTGKAGDVICVSEPLGGSFQSGKHLDFEPRVDLARKLIQQGPRPTAMMDLSDGLGSDLPRLASACGCGFELDMDAIPCNRGCTLQEAIHDGEDYELLMTFTPDEVALLLSPQTPSIYPIGSLCKEHGTTLEHGWQHFCA